MNIKFSSSFTFHKLPKFKSSTIIKHNTHSIFTLRFQEMRHRARSKLCIKLRICILKYSNFILNLSHVVVECVSHLNVLAAF